MELRYIGIRTIAPGLKLLDSTPIKHPLSIGVFAFGRLADQSPRSVPSILPSILPFYSFKNI